MLDSLRSLYRHQFWADEQLLRAVEASAAARQDAQQLACLLHIAVVQRFYLARFAQKQFDRTRASEPPRSWDQLLEAFAAAHAEQRAFLEVVSERELGTSFELAALGARFTLLEGMTQVVLHSQNHRGQCLTRLRELGGKPPTLDYILWARDHQPRPEA